MMLPDVFARLKQSTDVRNIVGTNPPRIYKHGHVPDTLERPIRVPYVTWFLASGAPEINLSDPPPADRATVQVDCWHQTSNGVEALAQAVRLQLEESAHMTSILFDEHEPETGLFRIALQFDIWTGRT